MSDHNPVNPLSNMLKNALNKAAFSGELREHLSIFDTCSYDEVIKMFPNRKALHDGLTDIALNEKAATFRKILFFFKHDEDALSAIIKGFNKDERYANNRSNYDDWGVNPDPGDLKKKRKALQDLAVELSRQDNIAQKSTTSSTPVHIRKLQPPKP